MTSLKPGVRLDRLSPQMVLAHAIVAEAYAELGAECVITSGTEGPHQRLSLHIRGDALDYRMRDVGPLDWEPLRRKIAERLGELYDVLLEDAPLHLHVEYDPPPPAT